ncbi:hypothetical protein BWQ96_04577 [Gracilariopsis chorda]|uniref:Uncharacterized protein n=2 Tax=Gracilariopsis chorda TaxID=448386 RepID=A0A2V3IU87_9FLOR|nr:hypothetical protein BWQ96_04577 [Gracilariopsis chorda]|eukprot:PXF45673.1 hypothetical protein BWQ96_04577 [Gracilariopsis chorda]
MDIQKAKNDERDKDINNPTISGDQKERSPTPSPQAQILLRTESKNSAAGPAALKSSFDSVSESMEAHVGQQTANGYRKLTENTEQTETDLGKPGRQARQSSTNSKSGPSAALPPTLTPKESVFLPGNNKPKKTRQGRKARKIPPKTTGVSKKHKDGITGLAKVKDTKGASSENQKYTDVPECVEIIPQSPGKAAFVPGSQATIDGSCSQSTIDGSCSQSTTIQDAKADGSQPMGSRPKKRSKKRSSKQIGIPQGRKNLPGPSAPTKVAKSRNVGPAVAAAHEIYNAAASMQVYNLPLRRSTRLAKVAAKNRELQQRQSREARKDPAARAQQAVPMRNIPTVHPESAYTHSTALQHVPVSFSLPTSMLYAVVKSNGPMFYSAVPPETMSQRSAASVNQNTANMAELTTEMQTGMPTPVPQSNQNVVIEDSNDFAMRGTQQQQSLQQVQQVHYTSRSRHSRKRRMEERLNGYQNSSHNSAHHSPSNQ